MRAPSSLSAFARRARRKTSSPELDRAEEEWWDRNAALMQRIWTLPAPISSTLRQEIVNAAARFLGDGVILEPGCGSGWPGRLLLQASSGIRIVGTDISAEQLALAREGAATQGLAGRTDYRQAEMRDLDLGEFDGAFVHAALHHLSEDEVASFLDIFAAGPAGLRVVFYEPVFVRRVPWLPRSVALSICRALGQIRRRILPRGLGYDESLVGQLAALERDAGLHGWFLSPKEVPFEPESLFAELESRFDVAFAHPVHFDAIELAQKLALLRDAANQERITRRVLRRALRLDRAVLRTGVYRACESRYAFWLIGVIARGSD